jgi:Spy/CpxP family protein refolding chaperone
MNRYIVFFLLLVLPASSSLPQGKKSPYAGQESRPIKSLSPEEIQSYENGEGMGFAKAAELNGYPGPRHVLDMAKELRLTEAQKDETQKAFDTMHEKAVLEGKHMVEAERRLDEEFSSRTINAGRLDSLTAAIGALQGKLRSIHLAAHLAESAILTSEQARTYEALRGYGGAEHHHEHMHH